MSRTALVFAGIAAAIAGLVAGALLGARIYYVHIVLEGQSSGDGVSVIDDVTVLKQLRYGGQVPDAIRHLENRLTDDLELLRPHRHDPKVAAAHERAVAYLVKFRPYPGARPP